MLRSLFGLLVPRALRPRVPAPTLSEQFIAERKRQMQASDDRRAAVVREHLDAGTAVTRIMTVMGRVSSAKHRVQLNQPDLARKLLEEAEADLKALIGIDRETAKHDATWRRTR